MNQGKYVFAQIVEFIPQRAFDTCVDRYKGNRYVKHFTCWNQMLCMMFGQLGNRESLSDLLLCIQAHKSKAYHLGFGIGVSKNNLAKANERRDWRIFADFAYILIAQARKCCVANIDFDLSIEGNVYAFDASVIDLSSLEIALLYKYRWQVELFFKWIKQHLKVKSFWGHSENAVRIQVYIAIITYTLVALVKAKLNSPLTAYEILQILSLSLLDKTTVKELVNSPDLQNVKEPLYNQLKLF